MNEPPPHLDPVPGPKPSRPHTLFLSMRGARMHPLRLLCLGGSVANLHSLTEGPSDLCTAPLSSTVGSPGHAAGRQIISSYITGLLSSYLAGMLITGSAGDGPLIAGSVGDGHRSGCLNSGSAGDGFRGGRLNSCPPSKAPSAPLVGLFYFWFLPSF
ncbi:hypothetical protein AMECASPLE_038649 [Ameca splendens]|uniref:Uncharacterized protein n=1 Tax=Ameca splendens TaxID=208324 RepID=A0ABV0ZU36_9TELE